MVLTCFQVLQPTRQLFLFAFNGACGLSVSATSCKTKPDTETFALPRGM